MKKETSEWMRDKAIEVGEIDGYEYLILKAPLEDALNGYIIFPKRPVREDGYNGILTYVPVHGGITCARNYSDCMIYGFDTLHYDSEEYPICDKKWIKEQIKIMLYGILKAKEVEAKYLRCMTNKGKAKYAQMVQDIAPESSFNFGVSINLLSGRL